MPITAHGPARDPLLQSGASEVQSDQPRPRLGAYRHLPHARRLLAAAGFERSPPAPNPVLWSVLRGHRALAQEEPRLCQTGQLVLQALHWAVGPPDLHPDDRLPDHHTRQRSMGGGPAHTAHLGPHQRGHGTAALGLHIRRLRDTLDGKAKALHRRGDRDVDGGNIRRPYTRPVLEQVPAFLRIHHALVSDLPHRPVLDHARLLAPLPQDRLDVAGIRHPHHRRCGAGVGRDVFHLASPLDIMRRSEERAVAEHGRR